MNIVEPAFGNIPIDLIRASKSNPRKHFNEAALDELAKSIKQSGVGQPILVRPLPNVEDDVQDRVEIVAGERRYRASKLAGLTTIPAIVRDMSDTEVLEFQLVENLQREDVHPIEEAEGYERLMKEHGFTADQCAEKVGKSRSYIYGRLKFASLAPDARQAFFDGKLSASTALLIARIPVPALQKKATEEIVTWGGGEQMPYRRAVAHVQQRYMLDLADAPFSIKDIKLVTTVGSCLDCPKRTGNQPEIFKDVDSADVCTDPDCFASKRTAHYGKVLATAAKKKVPVYDQKEGDKVLREDENVVSIGSHLWDFERWDEEDQTAYSNLEKLLKPEQRPEPIGYVRQGDGKVQELFDKTAVQLALEKAGICHTLEQYNAAIAEKLSGEGRPAERNAGMSEKDKERQAKLAELDRRVKQETAIRVAIYKEVRSAAGGGLSTGMLRIITKLLLNQFAFPDDALKDLFQFDCSTDEQVATHIDQAPHGEIEQLLMDLVVGEALSVNSWDLENEDPEDNGDYGALMDLAEVADVDVEGIRAELTKPEVEEEQAAGEASSELAIGDRVRIKNDPKGPNGRARKCCGKEGVIEEINGARYTVRTGPKKHELITDLVWNEIDKLAPAAAAEEDEVGGGSRAPIEADGSTQDAPAKTTKTKKKATPKANLKNPAAAAWPFPTGSRP